MPFSFFSPLTIRKSTTVRKRLQTQKRKAHDKYKLMLEQAEGARFKTKSDAVRDSSSSRINLSEDFRGTFLYESTRGITFDGDEGQASSASSSEELFEKKHLLSRFYSKLRGSTGKWELKLWQFLIITLSLQLPLAYVVQHVNLVNIWGALLVLLMYVIVQTVIAMPIYTVYIFLGNYGKKAYVSVWNCVPLFRGLAYSIAATALLYELLNVAFTGLSLLYLKDVIVAEPPWISCKFPNSHRDCIPMYTKHKPYTLNCHDEKLKYGAFDYYVSHVLQEGYSDAPQKNGLLLKWVFVVIIVWFLIYVLLSLDLRRYRYFFTILNITFLFCLLVPGLLATSFLSPEFTGTSHAKVDWNSLFNYSFWIQVSVHTLQKETPGDVITFSSLLKPTVNVQMYSVVTYSVKILIILTFTVLSSMFVSSVQRYYKVEPSCIESRGDHLIFAVIPDAITRWPVHQLMLPLYFVNLFFWGLSNTAYVLSSFLQALFEEFRGLVKWRFMLTTLMCAVLGTANIFLLRPNFMTIFSYIVSKLFVYVKTVQLLISVATVFVYSLDRLRGDYHFKCGATMEHFWSHGVKIAFLFLSVLFFLVCVSKVKELNGSDAHFVLALLAPILIGMSIDTCRYHFKLKPTLLNPDPKWGPKSRQRRFARGRFDAAEDLHFRAATQVCKHNCLLPSVALKREIRHWQTKQTVRTSQLIEDAESIEKTCIDLTLREKDA